MFEQKKPRYCTRGIAKSVPRELQLFLWTILDQEKQEHPMDYLQIFKLQVDTEETLWIHYCQEVPEQKEIYGVAEVGSEIAKALNGKKIFVIDDGTHITMLFAEEY